ncbi:helix-turn-helix domain-containing protein [Clostridium estertheticum]|uniref:helix-turn-helix domain-containing protein n=1 Tax=Clostridium estertheticum TaxID=238834 RepID=UPI00124D9C56|nr:helix-turn-helix transcriptional regulator [Clostridium estertheticum]MBZ9616768.1 helix-turn-helix transcriptional regulator [Clostridium estertheticum subsp. laramiense]WAG72475.1 helix-turn-helix transcriptional regulator [Clostridium estertheticum]
MIKINIDEILKNKGKTVYWLAKELKCNYNNINKLVKGETDSIKFNMLENIADMLECDISDILLIIKEKKVED